ncbi:MAG: type I secretion system permease/ATPase [Gammaproteobacteria bacterium]
MAAISDSPPGPGQGSAEHGNDPLLDCLAALLRLHGRPVSAHALAAGLPLPDGRLNASLFIRAAERQGFSARAVHRKLVQVSNLVLPAVAVLDGGHGACVVIRLDAARGEVEIVLPETGIGARTVPLAELEARYAGYCLFAQPRPKPDRRVESVAAGVDRGWFWSTLWRYRRYYLEAAFAAVLINVLTVATALFTMNVYDRVVPNNATETLIVLATGTMIAVAFEFVARNLRSYFIDYAGKKADIVIAGRLFAQAMGLKLEAAPASPGAFAAQLREFESLRDFVTAASLAAVSDVPFLVFFLWVIYLVGGPLYLVPLLAVPIIVGAALLAQVPLARIVRANLRESALRHGMLVEALSGREALKAACAEGEMQRRWEQYTALTGTSAARSRYISGLVVNFTLFVQQCVTVGMVVWGVFLIGEGRISLGALIAAVILSGRAVAPLGQLASLLTRFHNARVSYQQLQALMDRPLERPGDRSFLSRPVIRGEIAFDNVTFNYPGQKAPVLQGLTLSVKAGEHVAILGRIGSGKSTLVKLALGFYRPSGGHVLIDGVDIEQFDPADLRSNIGYVSQDTRLFHGTLRDNIALGIPLADDAEVLEAARLAGLDTLVQQHPQGFDLVIPEGGGGLSGGQQQAVAIARALMRNRPVLLLDEPTSAMDFSTEQTFLTHLKASLTGRTLILVTHKPTVLGVVDRIVVVDRGKVVLDGPRDQVLKQLVRQV